MVVELECFKRSGECPFQYRVSTTLFRMFVIGWLFLPLNPKNNEAAR
jgi:hypothetical protein